MKKTISLVVCCLAAMFSVGFDSAAAETQCSRTEQALWNEMSNMGTPYTIEEHVRTARIYRAMADRGCPENSAMYKEYSRSSLDAARSLVYIDNYTGGEKKRYDNMIKQATGF